MKRKKFSDYIVEKGLLSQDDLDKASGVHIKKGGSLAELLVEQGYIKETELVDLLSGYLSIPPVRILNLNIPKEVLSLIPETLARSQKVLPIGRIGNTLTLAMSDLLNVLAIDDVKKITKCEVNPIIAPLSEMQEAISTYYSGARLSSLEEIIKGQVPGNIEIIRRPAKEEVHPELISSIEEAPVIRFTNALLAKAV